MRHGGIPSPTLFKFSRDISKIQVLNLTKKVHECIVDYFLCQVQDLNFKNIRAQLLCTAFRRQDAQLRTLNR